MALAKNMGGSFLAVASVPEEVASNPKFEIDLGREQDVKTITFLYLGLHEVGTVYNQPADMIMPFVDKDGILVSDGFVEAIEKDLLPEGIQKGQWLDVTGYLERNGHYLALVTYLRTDLKPVAPADIPANTDAFNVNTQPVAFTR